MTLEDVSVMAHVERPDCEVGSGSLNVKLKLYLDPGYHRFFLLFQS
jgi:hypothetical protein